MSRTTIAAIEERLDPARFVRVHRGYFINLDYLAQIESLETGDARLTLWVTAQRSPAAGTRGGHCRIVLFPPHSNLPDHHER